MAPSSTTALTPPILSSTTTVDEGGATTISAIHPDIIQAHVLTRLDGPTLASAASASTHLYTLCTQEILWENICHSTWPSTNTPRLLHLISTFPNGSRSFFSDSFPLLTNFDPTPTVDSRLKPEPDSLPQLISAVDLYYKGKLVFCKVIETETVSGWFRFSPFRLDLLDPKDVVSTPIQFPDYEDACLKLEKDLALSWIMIEPIGRRAVNLSSHNAVWAQRHWLSGEIQVRFATILTGERGTSSEFVQCGIVVTCGGSEGGELQLREVSLQVENMDGKHLNGKDCLPILGRVLEGKKVGKRRREEEGRKRYRDYLERKRERKARKLRIEGTLDTLCMAFGVLVFSSFWMFVMCR